jgi:hypothetical protein
MINVRIKQLYDSDQKKLKIYNAIKKNGLITLAELCVKSGLDIATCRRISGDMDQQGYLKKGKKYSSGNKKAIIAYDLGKNKFKAKDIDECIEYFKIVIRSREVEEKNGKYDEIIKSNPNLKKYCLFDTKSNDYFKTGYKAKVNRGIGSTWSMFDAA